MSLDLNTRKAGDVVIIALSGRLTVSESIGILRDTLAINLESGARRFVIDLGSVSDIDSAGLAELISCRQTIGEHGGRLCLSKVTGRIKERLTMTKLVTVFDTHDAEAEAIAALQDGASA